jgi:BirA family biotin operon repressor/biotin-[acetyl-CoA-carboxylase] ligase
MSTRIELLKALDGRPGQLVSGEVLAQRLGISRTGVWKQLQFIKNAGLPLEGTSRQGYRLKAPVDSSLASFHARGWGAPHYFLSASSTQTLAKGGASAGLPEGHVWIAETQTKGRGRLDRRWESAYGGLWFSLLIRPRLPAARVPPLTLLAGLALRDAVEDVTGVSAKLKWPNDLLVSSRKLAGILTEMSGQIDRTEWVLIGVGVNVNNALPRRLLRQAASLYALTGRSWARAEILHAFLKTFHHAYERYLQEGFEPFRRSYWSHYVAPNRRARLKTAQGMIQGIARGVDASGAIMIESRRKIHLISEGEIVS